MSQLPQYNWNESGDHKDVNGSKFPITTLAARVGTLACLIVSFAVLKTNDVTLDGGYVLTYKDYRSYKYMFFVTIIGIIYTLLQIPFTLYYAKTKKHLISSYTFLKFDFYADKVMVVVLATAAGAAFGTTLDLKKYTWKENDTKIQDFLTMSYIPSTFLVVACFTSMISSIYSSLALIKDI